MLYNGVNHFNWSVSTDTALLGDGAVTLTADGVAHTKGSNTAVLPGVDYDCYGIYLYFTNGNTDSTARRSMVDILIDPAAGVGNAGSSWSVLINNLLMSAPGVAVGINGYQFYFPLFIPAGTAIGARTQDLVGGATVSISTTLYGQPTRPDLLNVGTIVQTLGATTATTSGVAVTPGVSGSMGSYTASLGTLTNASWWWQLGTGLNDAALGDIRLVWDIAVDATSKYLCASRIISYSTSASERNSKYAFGRELPIRMTPAGTDVYVRAGTGSGAGDSTNTACVYAVS
jgi:hypothetical protein